MKYLGLIILCMMANTAFSATPKPKIYVDFNSMHIYSRGVYQPKSESKHDVNPVKAEVIARENGIESAQKYFSQSCMDISKENLKIKSNLDSDFRSQGTEIYSNGFLTVNLRAPYKTVIHAKRVSSLKTSSGEQIVFSIPSKIDSNALVCGIPALEFKSDMNQTVRLQILPARSKDTLTLQERLVKLKFDKTKKALVVVNKEDAKLLKKILIKFNETGPTVLPVTTFFGPE